MLGILKSTEHPSCLALLEVTILVSFHGANPSTCDVVSDLVFAHVNEFENIIFCPGFILRLFCFGKLLGVATTSSSAWWPHALLVFGHAALGPDGSGSGDRTAPHGMPSQTRKHTAFANLRCPWGRLNCSVCSILETSSGANAF